MKGDEVDTNISGNPDNIRSTNKGNILNVGGNNDWRERLRKLKNDYDEKIKKIKEENEKLVKENEKLKNYISE